MLNLDTHILIHALGDELEPRERKLLSVHQWAISAIVIWEIEKLVQLKRVTLDLEDREVLSVLSKLQILPIDWQVGQALRRLDFRSDPADELIAATSLATGIPLITRDQKIRKSKVVPLA